ncbi:hypothetical protein I4U23_002667 [Adineta vaga]|nr:hypothetical protein I4U23_002667 [Adineta vaga]
MQPSQYSNPTTPSSWMTSNSSNMANNNSTFWSSGGFRKRKAADSDLDEKVHQKMFVTEEKMVKEMQTLSLDLATLNNPTSIIGGLTVHDKSSKDIINEDDSSDDDKDKNIDDTHVEFHKLLKDSLKNDDMQDSFLSKLCENERRKFTMQIVPYMPIHPAQMNSDTVTTDEKAEGEEDEEVLAESSSPVIPEEVKNDNDDHLFKMPSAPTPYTVEEPSDSNIKRASTMKRSYSQSNQSNSNLSVTELKSDVNDKTSVLQSQSPYFIVEPTVTPLCHTSSSTSSSSLSTSDLSVRITEFVENPTTTTNEFGNTLEDDDIDMQSVASSDTGDKMDDD